MNDLLFCNALARRGFKPGAVMDSNVGRVELQSFPYPQGNHVFVMARRIPADPNTLEPFRLVDGKLEART
jgi:hypothetical protein